MKLLLLSLEEEDFEVLLQIDSECTLLDLNKLILTAVDYPQDLFTSFLQCETDGNVLKEFINEAAIDNDKTMENTTIKELFANEEVEIAFVFDPLTERCFLVEQVEEDEENLSPEPQVLKKKGKAPASSLSELEMEKWLDCEFNCEEFSEDYEDTFEEDEFLDGDDGYYNEDDDLNY